MVDPVIPVVETKLHAPRRRRGVVSRPRLRARLDRHERPHSRSCPRPPGSARPRSSRSCSPTARRPRGSPLDRRDNEPVLFWTYVVAALRTAVPDAGRERAGAPADSAVDDGRRRRDAGQRAARRRRTISCSCSTTSTSSKRRRSTRRCRSWSSTCRRSIHLVIASRADPPLPLARLRARGELLEIRAADLRFTADEAAAYLNERDGPRPDPGGHRRARSPHRGLDRRPAARGAVDAGPRRHRRLHRRVRRRRPLHRRLPGRRGARTPGRGRPQLPARDLGPRTRSPGRSATPSPGDRRRADARAASTGRTCSSSRSTIDAPGTATTTSSPTCCGPGSSTKIPTRMPELHRRASDWYDAERRSGEAIAARRGRRALRPGRRARRAGRARRCAGPARRRRSARWLEALPDELFPDRPVLAIGLVGARMATGDVDRRRAAARARGGSAGDADATADRVRRRTSFARLPAQRRDVPRRAGAPRRRHRRDDRATPTASLELVDARRPPRPGQQPPRCWGSRTGRVGDLDTARRRYTDAVRSLVAPTSPTSSAARSDWPTSRSRRVGCEDATETFDGRASRTAATSTRRCGAPPTCTSA